MGIKQSPGPLGGSKGDAYRDGVGSVTRAGICGLRKTPEGTICAMQVPLGLGTPKEMQRGPGRECADKMERVLDTGHPTERDLALGSSGKCTQGQGERL